MAGSGTVGTLRALLTAEASGFQKTMKQSADAAEAFGKSMTEVGKTSTKVGGQLNRFQREFGGKKIQQEANNLVTAVTKLGGAARLTEKEQARVNRTLTEAIAKYKALGQTAPPAMIALANATKQIVQPTQKAAESSSWLTTKMVALGSSIGTFAGMMAKDAVRAFGRFIADSIEAAGQVVDLSAKTGLTTDTIQRFGVIAEQSGASIESITDAAFKLGVTLAGGGPSVNRALRALGLTLDDLQKLTTDEQFWKIARALAAIQDEARRNEIGRTLFGPGFRANAAIFTEATLKAAETLRTASQESLETLDAYGDMWTLVANQAKVAAQEIIAAALKLPKIGPTTTTSGQPIGGTARLTTDVFGKPLPAGARPGALGLGLGRPLQVLQPSTDAIIDWTEELRAAQTELGQLDARERAQIAAAQRLGASTDDLTDLLKQYGVSASKVDGVLKLLNEQTKKQVDTSDKLSDSLKKIGIITKHDVAEALKEFTDQQKAFAAAGGDTNRVLIAQLPKMKELLDTMEASGIESAEARAEYQRMGDAWRASINTSFDAAQGIEGMYEATKHLREEAERLNGIRAPFDAIADATWHLRPDNWIESPEAWRARQEPIKTFWKDEFPDIVKDAFQGMTNGMSYALSDMLFKLRGFEDGFKDIWRSIRTAFSDILGSMLNQFISGFLKQMFAAMGGQKLAAKIAGWGLGGAAAGGIGAAAAAGSAAAFTAPAAASAAGAAGIASLGWTVGAPTTAGAGFAATLAALAPFAAIGAGAGILGLGIWKKGWFRGGEEGTKVNPARDRFLAQFGGFQALASLLTSVTGEPGGGRLFTKLRTADTMQEFTSASQNILTLLQRRGAMPISPNESWRLRMPQPQLAAAVGAGVPAAAYTPSPVPATTAAAPVTMNVTIQAWDRADLNDAFREEIIPRFKDALQFNSAGLRTAVAGV